MRRAQRTRRRRRLAVAGLLLVLMVAVATVTWFQRRAEESSNPAMVPVRDNILLVTLDTARADRLGAYGYTRARTRHLDRLAAGGVRFEHAYSAAPITLPAHASILTGLYPFEHGVRNNGNFYLADRYETLATRLSAQGYATAAFVSSFVLDRRYGLARGFEVYDDRMHGAHAQVVSLEAERRGDRTALALTAWLERDVAAGRPFFTWLHLYDPHEPYRPPSPFREAFPDAPYDGEIAFTDAIIASVLDTLGKVGRLQNTIVAVVADHGESLGDHGEETHSMFVYEAAIRVPFLLWRPGRLPAGLVVTEPVRVMDIAPTLLQLVGAPALEAPHARSLVPLVTPSPQAGADARGQAPATSGGGNGGESGPPLVYAETYLPRLYLNWAPLRAVRDERWKFIEAPRPELYDLSRDPGETTNLYESQPRTGEALRGALARLTGGTDGAMAAGGLDKETIEKLASLGYVGAGVTPAPASAGAAPRDPKDVIALFNRLRRANSAVRERRFADALPILRKVLAEDPANAFARLVLASAHMGMAHYREAIAEYERYVALVPSSSYAHLWMAICYVRLGRQTDALREAEAALAIDPRSADARILRGGILASRGNYDAALRELRAAVESDPAKPMIRLDVAKVLSEAGRLDEARREYEAILQLDGGYVPALTGLGALEARAGNLDEAADILRRAVAADPTDDSTRFDLARVLEQQGRPAEAAAEYQRLLSDRTTSHAVREAAATRLATLER